VGHIGIGGSPKSSGGGGGASNVTVDYIKGYVNAGNSSTTPLGANAVFTGSAMDVTDFAVINVNVYSDVASATNGVTVQFSPDGTNWDHSHSTTYTSPTGVGYVFNVEYKYARVVYTNSGSAQTAFRLQTILKPTRVQSSLLRLNQNPTDYFFAELTKSVIQGKTTAGGSSYVDVKVTPSGSLTVALGDITGVVGQNTMANSLPVAISSDQSAIPVTDNGGSLTVDGTVAATQSGIYQVRTQDTLGNGITSHLVSSSRGLDVAVLDSTGARTNVATDTTLTDVKNNTARIPIGMTVSSTRLLVDGSGVTQPVSAASLPLPTGAATETTLSSLNGKVTACNTGAVTISTALPAGTNNIGDVDVLTLPNVTLASQVNPFTSAIPISDNAGSITVDGTIAATQSGAWSVTANAGTNLNTSALALESGGNLASVKTNTDNLSLSIGSTTSGQKGNLILGATTTAAPTYTTGQSNPLSLTTAGAVRVDGSATTQPVSGTVTANAGTGTFAISAASLPLPTGAATETTLSTLNGKIPANLTVTSTRLLVDGSGVTQPVSGTVAATQSGNWSVRNLDGSGNSLTSHLAGTSRGIDVAIIDGSGNQITSFGGGTQYADGTAAATPTGNQINWNESGTQRAVTLAKALPVQPGTGAAFPVTDNGGSLTVDGTVTANAGTGTFAISAASLPLPTGAATETTLSALNTKVTACNTGAVTISTLPKSSTSTTSSVAGSVASVTLVASNASRLGATIFNDSTAILYLKLGSTASTTSFTVKLNQDDYYELPAQYIYTGIITGVWDSATGAARVTELT